MSCTDPNCQVVLSSSEYCYLSPCTSGGTTYPKIMGSDKILGCNDGTTVPCHQDHVGCCY